MKIKKRVDIEGFIQRFEDFAEWDGTKLYLTINDKKQNGSITIMKYNENVFTYHRKNEYFWDIKEHKLNTEDLCKLIWNKRKSVNKYLKVNKNH